MLEKVLAVFQKEKESYRELIINSEPLETRVALLVDGRLDKFEIERDTDNRMVGGIYKGRVKNLDPGLKAAFVDIGFNKNAFLHYWDMLPAATDSSVEVVRVNKLESCYLRPLTWIGSEKLGVSPKGNTIHLMVAAWPWGAYLGEEGMKRGIRVKTSSYTRHHVNITMTQAKAVSNYTNSILANMEALDDGYDEALLLDASGFVSEGAGENLFVVKDGVIYTPDLSAGALNGITRNTVFHIAKDLGLDIVQKRITRDEVYIADEAFFTGTAAEVTPIRELDRLAIGSGSRGPITEKVQAAFFDIVNGRNPKYAHWLTLV